VSGLNKKMLFAPVLAMALALLLAGAISSLSFLPQSVPEGQTTFQPTLQPNSTPVPMPTSAPMVQSSGNGTIIPILFAVAATVVGVLAAVLLFSEKNLKKEIKSEK
jgi:hypothetical protein